MTTKSLIHKLEKKYGRLSFGDFLRAWRESEELSQSAFAKRLALSVQNLNDLEKGRRIPTPSRAANIARKMELPVKGLIQLALRDALWKEGFHYNVTLESA